MVQGNRTPTVAGEWECMECGYTEEGNQSRRPQRCPECSAPADSLQFFSYEEDDEAGDEWDEDDEEYEDYEDLDDDEIEDDTDM